MTRLDPYPRKEEVVAPTTASKSALPVVLTSSFMTTLDFFVVNVALPAIRHDLGASPAALEWVVAGFGLALAAGMITGGRLGDIYGRRRVFGVGLTLFTVASVACGMAPTAGALIAARAVQGLAAAITMPQVIAILRTSVPAERQPKAFAQYSLVVGLGAVFGQLIGGVLIWANLFGLDWRLCFLINLPIGVAALLFLGRIPESRHAGSRLDPIGVVLSSAALVTLVLPLIEGRAHGWPGWTWLSLGGSAVLFVAFGLSQFMLGRRGRRQPLVDLSLFRERPFTVGLIATQVFWMGQASFFLVLALYLQFGRHLSALESGAVFVAIGGGYLLTSMNSHRFAARLGRQVVAVGALIMVVGLLLMSDAAGHDTGWLLPGMAVDGLGMGMALAPLTTTVLSRVQHHHAGAAAGVLSTVNQTGNAVGVALLGIIFYSAADYTAGFRAGLLALAGLEILLALVIQALPKK